MPWCDDCDRFWNPNTMGEGGTCPTCGRTIVTASSDEAAEDVKAPWHFKLLIVAVVLYLGWRFVQLIGWLIQQF
jgi:hypothetical protein